MKQFLLIILFIVASVLSLKASHLMGGEITYTHVSGDDYKVTLVIYRDCSGIDLSATATVDFVSSCGTFSENFNLDSTIEVSQLCASSLGSSTCSGGTLPGTQKWVYSGVVTLPPCADWVISWTDGSRNPAITNLVNPDLENIYIEATLNNIIGVNNSSPQYLALPTPYLCANQLNIFNHGASDIDGDSLYYQFAQPLSAPGTPIAYTAGYTINDPIITTSGMNLNPETGEMCFTPSQSQICVVSVIVYEYRNNVLIGSQIREMQVVVSTSCNGNNGPTAGGAAATCGGSGGLTVDYMGSTVTQTDVNSFVMCPDDSLCFTIPFADVDGDNVTINTNIGTSIPSANYTINGNNTPNATLSICWVPTALDSGINVITIEVMDDACPISAFQYYTYDITVYDQPYAGPDQIICGTQTANLQAVGGGGYVWSILSGDTDISHLSCTNCDNTIADPDVTTTYLLTSSLAAACKNTDTVIVFVVPDFSADANGDTILCDYLSTPIGVDVSGPVGTYQFLWDNETTLSDSSLQNPMASPIQTTLYTVQITSPDGCVKKEDSVLVQVSPPPPLTLFPGDTTLCSGEQVTFDILFSNCQETATVNGQDDSPSTVATINNISCVPSGATIVSYTMDASFTGSNCPSWYTYDIIINGVTQFTQQCNQTGLDLTPFLPITSISVSANDEDAFSDNVTLDLIVNVVYSNNQLTYNWSPATNLTSTNINNPTLTNLDSSTTYTVSITDTVSGCSFDRSMDILLFEGYHPIASPDTVICPGQQVVFNIDSVSSSCTYTLLLEDSWGDGWNGADIDILLNGAPYLPNQTVPDCNNTTTGCENVITIPVSNGDIIGFNYTSGSFNSENTITLFDGDGVQVFTVNNPADGAMGPFVVDCSGGVSFLWNPSAGLSDPSIPNPIFNGITTETYTVQVYMTSRPECNGTSNPITIEVNNNDLPTISGDSAVCFGEPVSYTIQGADTVLWPDGSTGNTYTFTPQNDSLLTVTASTVCGSITINKHIVVYPEMNFTVSPDTIICEGNPVNLTLDGVLNECTYLLTLIDSAGDGWGNSEGISVKINGVIYESSIKVDSCDGSMCTYSMVIPINDGDVLSIEYTSGATDNQNTVLLYDAANTEILNVNSPTAGVLGTFNTICSNAYDISWNPSTQLSDPTITNPVFAATSTESYQATVLLNSDNNCFGTSNTILLDVRSIDVPEITGDTAICIGETITLSINADSVLWWGDTTNVSTSFTFSPRNDSLVSATASTFCVKNANVSHFVEVYPLPVINTIPDTTIVIQDHITLTTTGGTTYYWSPDFHLSCDDCPSPDASPIETTTYNVIVTDSNGCVSSKNINIEVKIPDLFIPTGISPNGDGVNDILYVRSLSIESMVLQVYDRWGNLVFESNDQKVGWDGTSKGKKLDAGVYIFKFEADMVTGEKVEQAGNITLFR